MRGGDRRHGLTRREFEVAELMADGNTNEAIGTRLGIAVKSVEATVRSIFNRFDLPYDVNTNRRVLAVRRFIEMESLPPSSIPAPASALVGREAEVVELEQLIAAHRVVVITGLGGIGKTRLALEIAHRASQTRRVRFIDLATTDALSARQRIFESFGVALAHDRVAERMVVRRLGSERNLIVIDNAESVRDQVRDLVTTLAASAATSVVVTSREQFGIPGECVWRATPLPPDAAATLLAIRLDEAGHRDIAPDRVSAWSMELGGIPLALELAATRGRALSSVARHPGLDGVLHDSYRQLPSEGRSMLRTLALFRAGFTIDAARHVVGDDRAADAGLAQLIASSLVERRGDRYRMLEPVRQFVIEQTTQRERRVHESALVDWGVHLADDAAGGLLHDPLRWRPLVAAESDNIDAALDAAVDLHRSTDALRMVGGVWPFWAGGSGLAAAHQRVERLIATLDTTEVSAHRTWALVAAGRLAATARMHDSARERLEEAVRLFELQHDQTGAAVARFWLARPQGRRDLLEQSVREGRALGNAFVEGWASLTLARDLMRAMAPVEVCIDLLDRVETLAELDRQPQLTHNVMLLRAEIMLQANWLGQAAYPVEAVDALLDEVEPFARQVGGASHVTDLLSIVSTNHLHHHRWEAARHSTAEQLETSAATQDPIVLAESILMAAVLREHDGRDDLARRAAVVAGPAFAEWAEPVWLAFTVHPSENLYRSATVRGQGRPATIDRLVTWAARVA